MQKLDEGDKPAEDEKAAEGDDKCDKEDDAGVAAADACLRSCAPDCQTPSGQGLIWKSHEWDGPHKDSTEWTWYGHSGWDHGMNTNVMFRREDGVGTVIIANAQAQKSFDDLDLIWAMRCVDELLMVTKQYFDDEASKVWTRIFSSVLNIINGRRSKRMEPFEAVALNLLTSVVSEGVVSAKDIQDKQNMGIVWKLLVAK